MSFEPNKNKITIEGAKQYNLKNFNLDIPLNGLICVTGVSGSGKSSLIGDILYPALCFRPPRPSDFPSPNPLGMLPRCEVYTQIGGCPLGFTGQLLQRCMALANQCRAGADQCHIGGGEGGGVVGDRGVGGWVSPRNTRRGWRRGQKRVWGR